MIWYLQNWNGWSATNYQSHHFNIIDKYINICYICISYLFMIYKDNRAHEQEAVHPDRFLGVASFLFAMIGDRDHGEVKKCL